MLFTQEPKRHPTRRRIATVASVGAKSANGDVRLGDVVRGSVVLETQLGDLEVGIREGTAAWLDVRANAGRVHNALESGEAPESPAEAVGRRRDPEALMPPARSAIVATGLRKSFGDKLVLDGVDLDVAEGTVFALLGPNGAGKTTIVHILSTLLPADAGTLRIAGHDPAVDGDAVRAAIGVTGQFAAVDGLLTGEENLILMADLHRLGRAEGRRRAAELLERFDLVDAGNRPAATYSGGMRRRLDIAMTLVGEPRIIFLDEPTAGLDPRSRHTMWQIIRDLVAGGVTVLLTTQYLDEADRLADRIAVLDHGRLIAEGTADELKRRIPGGHIRLQFADPHVLESAVQRLGDAARDDAALSLQLPNDGSVGSLRALLARLDREAIQVESLSVHTADLDDVFLTLTGGPR
jgi:ABC-2 type transport system ATP-binding protein